MNLNKKVLIIPALILTFLLTHCAQNQNQLAFKNARPAFQLESGGTLSTDQYNEYNPVLVKNNDGSLSLLFGSDRPCAGCSGHNLFIANSVSTYSDFLGDLPLFSDPVVVQVSSNPINADDFIHFAATTNAGSDAQITVYLNASTFSSGNIVKTQFSSGSPNGTTPTPIANSAYSTMKVGGITSNGTSIMAFNDTTLEVDIFEPNGSSTPEYIDILFGANAAVYVPEPAAGGIQEAWLGITDGAMAAGSPQGLFGFADDLARTLEEEDLFMVNAAGFYGGNDASDFITFSAVDAFTGSEDIYAVTTHTIGDMWDMATSFFDFGDLAGLGPGGSIPSGPSQFFAFENNPDNFGSAADWTANFVNTPYAMESLTGTYSADFAATSYIDYGNQTLPDTFSFVFVIKPFSIPAGEFILLTNRGTGGTDNGFTLALDLTSTNPVVSFKTGNGAGSGVATATSGIADTSNWGIYGVVVDTILQEVKIYHNGTDLTLNTPSYVWDFARTGVLYMGQDSTNSVNSENMQIDEFQFFDYALSGAEALAITAN